MSMVTVKYIIGSYAGEIKVYRLTNDTEEDVINRAKTKLNRIAPVGLYCGEYELVKE